MRSATWQSSRYAPLLAVRISDKIFSIFNRVRELSALRAVSTNHDSVAAAMDWMNTAPREFGEIISMTLPWMNLVSVQSSQE